MASILIVVILLAGLQPLLAVPLAPEAPSTQAEVAEAAASAATSGEPPKQANLVTKEEEMVSKNSNPAPSALNDIDNNKQLVVAASPVPSKTPQSPVRILPTLTAEKVRRGLASFINQGHNPGNFFVPKLAPNHQHHHQNNKNHQMQQQQKGNPQVAAEPATIVNVDPTAEAIIKGPNRSSTRAIGGPLRWGRRR